MRAPDISLVLIRHHVAVYYMDSSTDMLSLHDAMVSTSSWMTTLNNTNAFPSILCIVAMAIKNEERSSLIIQILKYLFSSHVHATRFIRQELDHIQAHKTKELIEWYSCVCFDLKTNVYMVG